MEQGWLGDGIPLNGVEWNPVMESEWCTTRSPRTWSAPQPPARLLGLVVVVLLVLFPLLRTPQARPPAPHTPPHAPPHAPAPSQASHARTFVVQFVVRRVGAGRGARCERWARIDAAMPTRRAKKKKKGEAENEEDEEGREGRGGGVRQRGVEQNGQRVRGEGWERREGGEGREAGGGTGRAMEKDAEKGANAGGSR